MKSASEFSFILLLIGVLSSCTKEGHVSYSFEVYNQTEDTSLTVSLSSWGGYMMYINGMYDSGYKFHQEEAIRPNSSLGFAKSVGDAPDPYKIPSSLTPPWEYITAIECDGVSIPKEYFGNPANWEIQPAFQINGTFSYITLLITPELIEQFRQIE